jgi:hypothetical protein
MKLKLGPMLSLAHVPLAPYSKRQSMTKIEALGDYIQDEELSLQIEYGIWTMMTDWNKLETSFEELICLEFEAGSQSETRYCNTVSPTIEELLRAGNDIISQI